MILKAFEEQIVEELVSYPQARLLLILVGEVG